MSKGRDRTVFQRDGKWVNKRNDSDRISSSHNTQRDAEASAKQMLHNQGGGELTIKGTDGRSEARLPSRQAMIRIHQEIVNINRPT